MGALEGAVDRIQVMNPHRSKVLLDLRCLSQPTTGIQVVAAHFLSEMLQAPTRDQLLVLVSESQPFDARLEDRQVIRSRIRPYDFRRQGEVAALINASSADVVLSPTYFMPLGVRKPYIITVHDLIPRKVWLGAPSLYAWGLLGWRMRQARAVVTVSEYSRNEILRYHPALRDRVHVVPSGYVVAAEVASPEKVARSLLLFASRFRHKNTPFGLQVFSILQQRSGASWNLHVVGDASGLLGAPLPPGVHLHGRVTDEQLVQLYQRCWGVLLPSMEEGFSLPLLDGMNHACVVFYSRDTAMRETAGNAGIGLELGQPESWAAALLAVSADNDAIRLHRTKALMRAAEFTPQRLAAALNRALMLSVEGWPKDASESQVRPSA